MLDRTGTIDMAGQGTVRLTRSGDRLDVSQIRPAPGWRVEVERDDDDDDESELDVEFQRGPWEIELEAELEDGELEVEVCVER